MIDILWSNKRCYVEQYEVLCGAMDMLCLAIWKSNKGVDLIMMLYVGVTKCPLI